MTAVLIGVFAGLGAATRYLASLLSIKFDKWRVPWGTYIVNMAGAFLIGLFFAEHLSDTNYKILATGFCGGLTTFSTFNFELIFMLERKRYKEFAFYFLLSYGIGFMACLMGLWLGKIIS